MPNRSPLFLLLVFFILSLGGCSAVQVSHDFAVDYPFTAGGTYAWQATSPSPVGEDLLDARFRRSIEEQLRYRGFRPSATPQLLVGYSYTVTPRLREEPLSTGFGFGIGRDYRYSGIGLGYGTTVSQFDQGVLVVSIYATEDGREVWRGTATREVTTHATPQQLDQRVAEMVQKVLTAFPPSANR
jgi:hypothetical protein